MVPARNDQMHPPISSEQASRKETYGFVTLIVVLLIASIATTITNIVIIYKLRLVPRFQFFDFASDRIVFHRDAYIDKIFLAKNQISGLSTVTGNVEVKSGKSAMRINQNGVQFASPRGFEMRCPRTDKVLFPFDFSSVPLTSIKTLSVPNGVRDVKLIRSPMDEDLDIFARDRIRIRGNEGVHIEGKHIRLEANSLFLASINSSITLDAHKGVYLNMDMFKSKVLPNRDSASSASAKIPQFKLCVCAKNGRLFRIPVKDQASSCADARFPQSENPCV